MNCASKQCDEEAFCAFTWPGSPMQAACKRCVLTAVNVAQHMGFELPIHPLRVLEAAETVRMLEEMRAEEASGYVRTGTPGSSSGRRQNLLINSIPFENASWTKTTK